MRAYRQFGRRVLSHPGAFRSLASLSKSCRFDVTQGGTVVVDLRGQELPQSVDIVSAWQDFCTLETAAEAAGQFSTHYSAEHNSLTVSGASSGSGQHRLRITVPQSIDLVVSGDTLALRVKNKIEGDVRVECTGGSVEVDKVRGMRLLFHCPGTTLTVHKLLEGNVNIAAHSVAAKMINGDVVDIAAETTCAIEAMYLQQCHITASDDVHIAALNGQAVVHSRHGSVKLGGIDGTFDVLSEEGSVTLQINKLSQGLPSCASASRGGITAQVDPEIQASVRCESQGIAGRAKVTIVSDAFVPSAAAPTPGLVVGRLTGKSASVKRPSAGAAASSGKIDLRGAELQALAGHGRRRAGGDRAADVAAASDRREQESRHSFLLQQQLEEGDGAGAGTKFVVPSAPSSSSSSSASSSPSASIPAPTLETTEAADLTLTAHGHVRLETLSWFEAIRRKHGFSAGEGSTPPSAGRTAGATARAKELV